MAATQVIDGRFALEHEHRRGGMGTVWRARDLGTSRPVAVKLLHAASVEQGERFRREAAFLAEFSDDRIVSYVASGATGEGVPYLVMEWLEGETLAERLATRPLGLAETLAMAEAVACALAIAHRRGVIHRDLKPSNLFLRGGHASDVVLLDLGIARRLSTVGALTQAGAVLGTPSYMAPEQAQGDPRVDPAADVYSLGGVLFECLAGEPPFAGAQVLSVLAKVIFEDAPDLRELRPELPAPLCELVARMLAKAPAARPAHADAVLAALAALGPCPELPPPSAGDGAHAPTPLTPSGEQQLISVIVATGLPGGTADGTLPGLPVPDVTPYGAELRHLVDGTILVTLEEKRGAATDLAVRAARCALRVRDLRPGGRVALATGRALLRGRVHVGEAVDRAAALLTAHAGAPPGHVWIDRVTAGLLGARFHVRDEGAGPQLEHEEPSIDPSRQLLGQPSACVGREHELGTLELSLRACIDESSPRATLVTGPPGQGKSRLRHELVRRSQGRGDDLTVLLGLGDPIRTASTCGLIGRALLRHAGAHPDAPEAERRAALARLADSLPAAERAHAAGFLGELCGLPLAADAPDELRAALLDPRALRQQIGRAWLALLRAELARRPLLLVLDDLQWTDALSVALVELALRELRDAPLCVLALARPEVHELFPTLWAPHLATLPLRPLPPAATARLVRQVLGELPAARVAALVERAAGNALYLEELIRAAAAHEEVVPATVLAMLQARIGLLAPLARRILRAASVLGESFTLAGVRALVGEELGLALELLVREEVLEVQPDDAARAHWRFRHVLMRDAAYTLLTDEERGSAHGAAACFLEAAGDSAAVIAAHYQRGGEPERAIPHFIVAAEQAFRGNDMAAAVELVSAGLAAGASGRARGELQGIAAPACFNLWDFPGCWAAASEAVDLLPPEHGKRAQGFAWRACVAMQLNKVEEVAPELGELLAARPGEADLVEFSVALGCTVVAYTPMGRRAEAARLVARLAELDAESGERLPMVRAAYRHGHVRFSQMLDDDVDAAWQLARWEARIYEARGLRLWPFSAMEIGDCARRFGPAEDAIAELRPVVARAQAEPQPVGRAYAEQHLATILAEDGADADQAEARQLALSVLAFTGEGNAFSALGHRSLALVELRAGALDTAEQHAIAGRDTMRALGMISYYPHFDRTLLEVLLARGELTRAAALAEELRTTVASFAPLGSIELPAREIVARALARVGRLDEARAELRTAIAVLEGRRARLAEARRTAFDGVSEHVRLRALALELAAPSVSFDTSV